MELEKVIEAWEDLAPDKSFGAMTLEQFKARVKPSLDTRDTLMAVKNARIDAQTDRFRDRGSGLRVLNPTLRDG